MSLIYYSESGYEFLNQFLEKKKYSKIFVLTDTHTNDYCSGKFLAEVATEIPIEIIEIEPGEAQKNISTCIELWNILIELEADRRSLIIGLGGGVITDIAGFVASIFKRGIDFILVPTSLLAMVDAALGGKNGVDVGGLKNQIGSIVEPQLTLVDFRFLDTLANQQVRSGYAEMLKHGLIADKEYWKKLSDIQNIDLSELNQLIIKSVEIKTKITTQDPYEKGIRKSLNFGHTLGHAIESYFLESINKTTLLHGDAIAIGMILESYLSLEKGKITLQEYTEVKSVLKNIYPFITFESEDINKIIKLLSFDKKNEYGEVRFVLLQGIGNTSIHQLVSKELIFKAFEDYKSS